MGHLFLYCMFTSCLMISATAVIFMRTPIHSLLLLIIAFFNAAGLFLVLGAEFLALILILVYVGAVCMLFLFVVMTLNVDSTKLRINFSKYTGFSAILMFIMCVELVFLMLPWHTWEKSIDVVTFPIPKSLSNTHALGHILYTHYFYIFQMSGFLLFVAMLGVVLLTLQERRKIQRQVVTSQIKRTLEDTLEIRKVPFNKGIKI